MHIFLLVTPLTLTVFHDLYTPLNMAEIDGDLLKAKVYFCVDMGYLAIS